MHNLETNLKPKARKGYILYLKHSGERIGDLRSLSDEELHDWFLEVRDANEQQARQQRELLEKIRKNQARAARRK